MLYDLMRRTALSTMDAILQWMGTTRNDQFESFLDQILSDVAYALDAGRITLMRCDIGDNKWKVMGSVGIMKSSGTYYLSDIPDINGIAEDEIDCGTWFFKPRANFGFDAYFFFSVPYGPRKYYCAVCLDDTEQARDFSSGKEMETIGQCFREAILTKLRIFHSEEKAAANARVYQDALTGLPNRRKWEDEIKSIPKISVDTFIIMIDLDFFKKINDKLGHRRGDEVLRAFSQILMSVQIDFPESFFARFGGEEFVGFIRGNSSNVDDFISRLNVEAAKLEIVPWGLTFSSGSCKYIKGLQPEEILNAADVAAFAAKTKGRNCHVWVKNLDAISSITEGKSIEEMIRILCY